MMSCCCPHTTAAGKLFSLLSRFYRRRYKKHGLEKSQRQLVAGLMQAGISDAVLLEIGSGVGFLNQHLLGSGARKATGIELSAGMLKEANRFAQERGLQQRVDYIQGDFVQLANELENFDVSILDKVICCYPDADTMTHRSLGHTRRVYALTIPRDLWYVRTAVAIGSGLLWLMRSSFRSYVHDPVQIEHWVTQQGFSKQFEDTTPVWLTQVYVRNCPACSENT